MGDFFKALIEKLRVDLLLASLAVAILLFKLFGFDVWWMLFTFCIAYIVLLVAENAVKSIRHERELEKLDDARIKKAKNDSDKINEEVWKRFYALDSKSLDMVKKIYLSESDPSNPLRRYIQDGGTLEYEIANNYNYLVPLQDCAYLPLLHAEHIAYSSVITFHPYYLKLVAHYVKTGKKERV